MRIARWQYPVVERAEGETKFSPYHQYGCVGGFAPTAPRKSPRIRRGPDWRAILADPLSLVLSHCESLDVDIFLRDNMP